MNKSLEKKLMKRDFRVEFRSTVLVNIIFFVLLVHAYSSYISSNLDQICNSSARGLNKFSAGSHEFFICTFQHLQNNFSYQKDWFIKH